MKNWNDEVTFHRVLSLLTALLLVPFGLVQVAASPEHIDDFFFRSILAGLCCIYFLISFISVRFRRRISLWALPIYFLLLLFAYHLLILNRFAPTYIIGHFIVLISVSMALPTRGRLIAFNLFNLALIVPTAQLAGVDVFRTVEFGTFSLTVGLLSYLVLSRRLSLWEDLRRSKESAEAANEAKSVFLSRMSHEIRTPLNAIIGAADLMIVDRRNENLVRILKQGGANLLSIVSDILELSTVEAGRATVNESLFRIREVVKDTTESFSLLAAGRGLELGVEEDPLLPETIVGDENKLRQILLNLLGNALKFTRSGRVDLMVRMRGEDRIEFLVLDTGPGIPAADLNKIFEPYYSSDSVSLEDRKGSGLGLAITRSLVELLGGEISADSRPGQGSEFCFWLPIKPADALGRPDPPKNPGDREPSSDQLAGMRILIAEDNEINSQLLDRMIRKMGGAPSDLAGNGERAVELFESRPYELVFMDKEMPVMDGLEATRRIRAIERRRGDEPCLILAVTAAAFEDDRRLCLEAGCDDCLPKPITTGLLKSRLDEILLAGSAPSSGEP